MWITPELLYVSFCICIDSSCIHVRILKINEKKMLYEKNNNNNSCSSYFFSKMFGLKKKYLKLFDTVKLFISKMCDHEMIH